ncbi:hypothetical protein EKK58_12665 [Candidatus Dependentiae bacterium]|nr:MAG: hypothetical protein EKK58_12665 [Candidatus Dependentiae bacterium]
MARNIKNLIKGLSDSPIIKEIWDITPVTTVTTPDLAIVETSGCTVTGGQVVTDSTGVTDPQWVTAVKTNITMQGLETDKTIKFGFEATDVPTDAPCILGIYIAPGNLSAAQVATEVKAVLFSGAPLPNNRIFHCALSFNTTYQAPTTFRIPNAATPNGVIGNFSNIAVGRSDLNVGSKSGMLLARRSNDLYIGRFDVKSDGSDYDLNGRRAIINGPVFPDTLTVYYITLSVDLGNGLQNIAYIPSVTVESPAYDVTGTSASLTPPPNNVDWINFDNPIRPSFSTATQAVLPSDVRIDQMYRTYINPAYTGPDPTPYGHPLKNNQTVLINGVSGLGAITALVDNQTLVELVDDITQPITDQQVTMLQTITDLGDLIADAQADVNKALLNAPEVVAYVKNLTGTLPNPLHEFSTSVTFDSLHEAYIYLISLPVFIKKRIVLDDRLAPLIEGEVGYLYNFIENNITISSYVCFTELFQNQTWVTSNVTVQLDCTSIRFDKFTGNYESKNNPIPSGNLDNNPSTQAMPNRVHLMNNVKLFISDQHLDLSGSNSIVMGQDCSLYLDIVNTPYNYQPIYVHKGERSFITVNNISFPATPIAKPFLFITTPVDNYLDTTGTLADSVYYTYLAGDPFRYDPSGQLIVVRDISQLGAPTAFGQYVLQDNRRYLFAKSLDLGTGGLLIPGGFSVTLHAVSPDIWLKVGQTGNVIENRGICNDNGVSLMSQALTGHPAILNYGTYIREGGKIQANTLFNSIYDTSGGSSTHIFRMNNVDHYMYSGNYRPSAVSQCRDFRLTNIRLHDAIEGFGYMNFNTPNVGAAESYLVDGISGEVYTTGGSRGVFEFTPFTTVDASLSNVFTFKNICIKNLSSNTLPLYSIGGNPLRLSTNPLFNYEGKRYGVTAVEPSASSRGTLSTATLSLVNAFPVGFRRDVHAFKLLDREAIALFRQFSVRIKGKIRKTTSAAGDGRIFAAVGKPNGIGGYDVFNITVPLPSANTQVAFESRKIINLYNQDTIEFCGSLSTSTTEFVYFTDLELDIAEIN